jgi:hypothetical protein
MFETMAYEGGSVVARVSRTCLFSAFAGFRWPFVAAKVPMVD